MEDGSNLIDIIIPNWNGEKWLPGCLDALEKQTLQTFKITIVDNGSTDNSVSGIREHDQDICIIELDKNYGFATAVNRGIKTTSAPLIWLLNTDTIANPNCLKLLVENLERSGPGTAAVAPLMLSIDDHNLIDDAGNILTWYGEAIKMGHGEKDDSYEYYRNIFSPSAGCTLYKRSFFDTVGLLDKDFFAYLEDIDLGLRGRLQGFDYLLEKTAIVYHKGHGSDIDYNKYISLVTCNRLNLFFKNIPLSILLKKAPKIIYGQIYYLLAFGHLFPALKGYWMFFQQLPATMKKRKTLMKKVRLSKYEIENLLENKRPDEGIWDHLKKLF